MWRLGCRCKSFFYVGTCAISHVVITLYAPHKRTSSTGILYLSLCFRAKHDGHIRRHSSIAAAQHNPAQSTAAR